MRANARLILSLEHVILLGSYYALLSGLLVDHFEIFRLAAAPDVRKSGHLRSPRAEAGGRAQLRLIRIAKGKLLAGQLLGSGLGTANIILQNEHVGALAKQDLGV